MGFESEERGLILAWGLQFKSFMLVQSALMNHTALPVLGKSLDAGTLRNKAIASNLANVTTPGYQRIEVAFEETLKQALKNKETPPPGDFPVKPDLTHVEPVAFRSQDATRPGELNNVDIDMEMTKLAENQIAFSMAVRFVQEIRGKLESAIKGQAA